MLTEDLSRKLLNGSIACSAHTRLGCLLGRAPYLVEDGEISKALARKLALDLDSLPALEAVGRSPVSLELAMRESNRGPEASGRSDGLGLDHLDV